MSLTWSVRSFITLSFQRLCSVDLASMFCYLKFASKVITHFISLIDQMETITEFIIDPKAKADNIAVACVCVDACQVCVRKSPNR